MMAKNQILNSELARRAMARVFIELEFRWRHTRYNFLDKLIGISWTIIPNRMALFIHNARNSFKCLSAATTVLPLLWHKFRGIKMCSFVCGVFFGMLQQLASNFNRCLRGFFDMSEAIPYVLHATCLVPAHSVHNDRSHSYLRDR